MKAFKYIIILFISGCTYHTVNIKSQSKRYEDIKNNNICSLELLNESKSISDSRAVKYVEKILKNIGVVLSSKETEINCKIVFSYGLKSYTHKVTQSNSKANYDDGYFTQYEGRYTGSSSISKTYNVTDYNKWLYITAVDLNNNELWNIITSIYDSSNDIDSYLPILACSAMNYIPTNTNTSIKITGKDEENMLNFMLSNN